MLTPQSANETVHRLEQAKLIMRTRDPGHGRILRLEITDAGREILKGARQRTDRIEAKLQECCKNPGPPAFKRWLVDIAQEFSVNHDICER